MIVCISLTGLLLSLIITGSQQVLVTKLFMIIFTITAQCTGFITCQLAIIRIISILWPKYNLYSQLILAASLCFGSAMIILMAIEEKARYIPQFVTLIAMFVIVISSNILCITKLASLQLASWKRSDATLTIGIRSILFCSLYVGFLVIYGFYVFKCISGDITICTYPAFEIICLNILLPLNSACNPIVYFVRNVEMRN